MGTEILASDGPPERGEETVVAGYVEDLDEPAEPAEPADPADPQPADPADPADPSAGAQAQARRDAGGPRSASHRRRRLLQLVGGALLLVFGTAFVVDHQADRRADHLAAARLAVDLRIDQPPTLNSRTSSTLDKGAGTIEIALHNLGERAVQLTGLRYRLDNQAASGRLLDADVTVPAGRLLNRVFDVRLPCGTSPGTAVPGLATLTAVVRTADGHTHTVPVDVDALNDVGGVFGACRLYARLAGEYDANSQVLDDGGVRITLTLPTVDLVGSNFVQISVQRDGVPANIVFLTTPHLPAQARAGARISVVVRPVVTRCPRGLDLTTTAEVGLRIGPDMYPDPYLPLQVAQAVGRACAGQNR